jgi:tetratricopeptide (TPR) repeat protein/predicted Ser/Thr protein kinase
VTPEQYEQIRELFLAAREEDPSQQAAFLDRACGGDDVLRAEVESLLANDEQADTFLRTPALGASFAVAGPEAIVSNGTTGEPHARSASDGAGMRTSTVPPERIGQYKILGVLGEGGMGVVYRAEQENPRRTVALKVIRPGIESREMLKRFAHESQVLGWLQHPGIAQIFEAGTADTGHGPQPFFAMELVLGQPLTKHVETQQPTVRERLEFIVKVCDAVQHAHQKGVVHRDLKPGNILVDGSGQPKILDFGVARATDADIRTTTLQTDLGQLIGTIAYMSPEQVAGDSRELDTRSDVYALGVICYELLAGRVPHDVSHRTIPQAARLIEEEDPAPLSSINRFFRGDIDTIIAKALEKDKDRRYQSASDLGEDIRRYLSDEPITARPATTIYQLRKFAKRNKALVAAVAVVFVALSAALIHMTWERNRAVAAERLAEQRREEAETQRIEAQRQAAIAQAVNEFLNDDLLATAGPLRTPNRDITVREVLDAASKNVAGKFKGQPETEASIHSTLGRTYEHLGEYEVAELHLTQALKLYREALGEKHLYTFDAMEDLALAYRRNARYQEAEELFTGALEGKLDLLGERHFETTVSMNDLATLYHTQGRFDEAEHLYLRSLEIRRQLFGEEHPETAACECNLANLYEIQGRYDEAEAMHVKALGTRRATLGEEHVDTLMSMNSLAKVYNSRKEYDRAEPLWQKVMEVRRRLLGEQHPDTLKTMNNLAVLYRHSSRYDEAEQLWAHVLDGQRRLLGEQHPHTLVSANNLADLYGQMGRHEEAAALFKTTIEGARISLPEGHWYTGVFLTKYGVCLTNLERFNDAEAALSEARRILSTSLGADHDRTKTTITAMIELYETWGRPDAAAEYRSLLAESLQPAGANDADPPRP